MTSVRDICPACHGPSLEALHAMTLDGWIDYFRCPACGHIWNIPAGREEPAHQAAPLSKKRTTS